MTMAAEDIVRGSLFVDYIGLFVPAGVVTGALIAALVAWWNERRSPLDQLKSLIDIRKDWPPYLKGVEAVDYEIGRQLAKLRIAADVADLPSYRLQVDSGLAAVQQARRRRQRTTRRLMFWLTMAVIVIGTSLYWTERYPDRPANERIWVPLIVLSLAGPLLVLARDLWESRRKKIARAELLRAAQAGKGE
ncbi:hypothetical protein ACFYV7_25050 [Nocardia suismassiliense]|uniref:Uncharacterized protein n=1 Tax=Nocardia suismassiliense TaxID=2077092 RepID=A0ABW6QXU3_9NOCA